MSENQVTKTSKKAVAIPKDLLGSFIEDAGAGTENISADDMKIPFIRIIQPTSPEVKKKTTSTLKVPKPVTCSIQ